MKDQTGKILAEYVKGDQTRRLHLFLTYRDLRRRFMDLEKMEGPLHYQLASVSYKSTGVGRRLLTRVAGALNSFISI